MARKTLRRPSRLADKFQLVKNKPKNKFNAIEKSVDGITFRSTKEADRYEQLKLLLRAGKIRDLTLQPRYVLVKSVKFSGDNRAKPAMRYTADFSYYDVETGRLVVEDVKSEATKQKTDYKMRRHMMLAFHNIEVLET